jgi:hypothetical protein
MKRLGYEVSKSKILEYRIDDYDEVVTRDITNASLPTEWELLLWDNLGVPKLSKPTRTNLKAICKKRNHFWESAELDARKRFAAIRKPPPKQINYNSGVKMELRYKIDVAIPVFIDAMNFLPLKTLLATTSKRGVKQTKMSWHKTSLSEDIATKIQFELEGEIMDTGMLLVLISTTSNWISKKLAVKSELENIPLCDKEISVIITEEEL